MLKNSFPCALIATKNVRPIIGSLVRLAQAGWIVIVDEHIYTILKKTKGIKAVGSRICHAYSYTCQDLEPGDPLEFLHLKFLQGFMKDCSGILPIRVLYVEDGFEKNYVPIGTILYELANSQKNTIIVQSPNYLSILVDAFLNPKAEAS